MIDVCPAAILVGKTVNLDAAAFNSDAFCNIREQMSPGVRVKVPGGEPIKELQINNCLFDVHLNKVIT